MARTILAVSTGLTASCVRQPRVAIGGLGLISVLLADLIVSMLGNYPIL